MKTPDSARYMVLLEEARRYRNAQGGQKDTAYIRLKRQVCNLELPQSYEQRVKALCEALRY